MIEYDGEVEDDEVRPYPLTSAKEERKRKIGKQL